MRFALTISLFAVAALPWVITGQTAPAKSKAWTLPRTPDGQPDLQGIWTNATLTPFERPREYGDKAFFTEQEAGVFEQQRIQATNADRPSREGEVGSYNNFWFDRGTKVVKTRRTSLVVDPPDGRVPAFTAEARKIYDQVHLPMNSLPSNGPEDRLLTERCILFGGAGPPMLPEPYNNNYQILQTRDYVTIVMELNHEARIIPLDARPQLEPGIRQWVGSSRGRWDGDTLVVESTGFKSNQVSRFGVAYLDGMSDGNLKVTERFTRTDAETITYQATIDDPTVYTRPWTVEISMTKRTEPLYEYACHEGNYGMFGMLAGAREEEAKAAKR